MARAVNAVQLHRLAYIWGIIIYDMWLHRVEDRVTWTDGC